MPDRIAVAREAMRAAFQVRRSLSIPREQPVNPFDIAESLGVEVRFMDAPSLEGMFSRLPHPVILLPTLLHRPIGRVSFSCAHELGHAQLGHESRVDEILAHGDRTKHLDEHAADVFAASLLMPRPAVLGAFRRRGLEPEQASAPALFTVSCELCVGYESLLRHVRFGLSLADDAWLKDRLRHSPKSIRESVAAAPEVESMVIADAAWARASIDLEMGELLAISRDASMEIDRTNVQDVSDLARSEQWCLYRGVRPGRARSKLGQQMPEIRVARRGYSGPFIHRYLEDPEAQ